MLGSKMTDFSGDLSWELVRRCSCVVRRRGPAGICAILFRFEYKGCQGGKGKMGGAEEAAKLLYTMAELVISES